MARSLWWMFAGLCSVGAGLWSVPVGLVVAGVLGMFGALYLVDVED